tara:strand:+ start:599 stop:811 length:213 start_codon:yes stop_codon:yes gene_type:complete
MSRCCLSDALSQIKLLVEEKRFIDAKEASFKVLKATGGISPLWTEKESLFLKTIIESTSDDSLQSLLEWV